MSLRQRLALTILAVALPGLVCLMSLQSHARRRLFEDTVTQTAFSHMVNGGRARCEAAATTWSDRLWHLPMGPPPPQGFDHGFGPDEPPHWPDDHGPPPMPMGEPFDGFASRPRGFTLFAYDTQLASQNTVAPALSPAIRQKLTAGAASAFVEGDNNAFEALVRMPWTTGPCAVVGVSGVLPPPERGALHLPPTTLWVPPLLIALISVWFALGPVLKRVRRLTRAVSQAPLQLYNVPIDVSGRDEIGALARAFSTAGQEIHKHIKAQEQRERTLRNFLENTTHDVSIPLTVLQGYISQIQAHARSEQPVKQDLADAAMHEAHYIASLLHNLNVAAKLEAGEPHIRRERLSLNAVVLRAVGRHAPVAKRDNVELQHGVPEEDVWVTADVTLIEQAISNVVYNAIRYNRPGGHVAVTLEATSNHQFVLQVVDDGPGVPEDQLLGITERYARGNEARSRNPQGRGLGLNIAKRVCVLHDWQLVFSTSSFGGLQVSFEGLVTDT